MSIALQNVEYLEAQIASLRLTDEEREAVEAAAWACGNCDGFGGVPTRPAVYKGNEIAATLRNLLERLRGER